MWHPITPEKTFLRFVTALAEAMGCPRREVCRPMAWHFWRINRGDAHTAFKHLARG